MNPYRVVEPHAFGLGRVLTAHPDRRTAEAKARTLRAQGRHVRVCRMGGRLGSVMCLPRTTRRT